MMAIANDESKVCVFARVCRIDHTKQRRFRGEVSEERRRSWNNYQL